MGPNIMYVYDPMYSESLDALKEDLTRMSDDVAQQMETIAETQATIAEIQATIAEKTVEPYESGLVFGFLAALLVCVIWAVSFRP